jgi:hypothetical protein
MKVLIHISSQKKIFLLNIAQKFYSQGAKVDLLIRDEFLFHEIDKKNIDNIYVEQSEKDIFLKKKSDKLIFKNALDIEKKYHIKINLLMSKDRALGRGYLSNVDNYVDIERANWNINKKLHYFINHFTKIEETILKSNPDLIISVARNDYISIIASVKKIKYFTLSESRIGSFYHWSDNDFNTSKILINNIKKNLKKKYIKSFKKLIYQQPTEAIRIQSEVKFSLFNTIKDVLKNCLREIKIEILGSRKKFSYSRFGWNKVIINRFFVYNFFIKQSIKLQDEKIRQKKIVYIPLHLEPEVALMGFSPEFTNSFEMIVWLSKSLPSNFAIVVKEQPNCYGMRSIKYYKNLLQIPNVHLAHPKIHPWKWIKRSFCIATITGTTAIEAVGMLRPVLSFGKHQIVNYLPSVSYCNNYFTTKKIVDSLISKKINLKTLIKSRSVLMKSIHDSSFVLNDYPNNKFARYDSYSKKKNTSEDISFKNLIKII